MSRHWHRHWKRTARTPQHREEAYIARQFRRKTLIESAVRQLGASVSHEQVAAATGIPLGFLQWVYPTIEDLQSENQIAR